MTSFDEEFEVMTLVAMKKDVVLCGFIINRRFGDRSAFIFKVYEMSLRTAVSLLATV
jgi:hypothetical protein